MKIIIIMIMEITILEIYSIDREIRYEIYYSFSDPVMTLDSHTDAKRHYRSNTIPAASNFYNLQYLPS